MGWLEGGSPLKSGGTDVGMGIIPNRAGELLVRANTDAFILHQTDQGG